MGVRIERNGHAVIATLDWPEQRNAMGPDECRELTAALTEAQVRRNTHHETGAVRVQVDPPTIG